jgi:hypothetical protein
MNKQLCWLPSYGMNGSTNGQLVLHLRLDAYQPWKPYTAYSGLCVADYRIPGGSKGWATSQKLIQAGWHLVPTVLGQKTFKTDDPQAA